MEHVILSRTDSIGDVVLTLPLAGFLKSRFPSIRISFIGKAYTQAVVLRSRFVDEFIDKEKVHEHDSLKDADAIIFALPERSIAKWSKEVGIKKRIGTGHRFVHYLYLNKRVNFSRRRSELHEAQLNFKLLEPLGIDHIPDLEEIPEWYGLPEKPRDDTPNSHKTIILHPKSRGSAMEWPLDHFSALIERFKGEDLEFLITGVEAERKKILEEGGQFFSEENVRDLTGKQSLEELMETILNSDGMIAASTGPLHIAAASGVSTLGLYPSIQPMHPGRWAPLGTHANYLSGEGEDPMRNIEVKSVEKWITENVLSQ